MMVFSLCLDRSCPGGRLIGRGSWGLTSSEVKGMASPRGHFGVDMKAHAETSAGRIPDSAVMIAGALGGVLIFTVAFPFTLSNPFPTPKQNDWVIAPTNAATNAPTAASNSPSYQLASLPTERIIVPAS